MSDLFFNRDGFSIASTAVGDCLSIGYFRVKKLKTSPAYTVEYEARQK